MLRNRVKAKFVIDVAYCDETGELSGFATREEADKFFAVLERVRKLDDGALEADMYSAAGHLLRTTRHQAQRVYEDLGGGSARWTITDALPAGAGAAPQESRA